MSRALDLCKIELILKKRPKKITVKIFNKCIEDFDKLYIIEVLDEENN